MLMLANHCWHTRECLYQFDLSNANSLQALLQNVSAPAECERCHSPLFLDADTMTQAQVNLHLTASLGELAIFVSGRTTEIWWPPEVPDLE